MSALRRVERLRAHVAGASVRDADSEACVYESGVCAAPVAAAAAAPAIDVDLLDQLLMPYHRDVYHKILTLLSEPVFEMEFDLTLDQMREQTIRQLKRVAAAGIIDIRDHARDPVRLCTCLETLVMKDSALSVKAGVHFVLFGGAIMLLGTKRHHDKFIEGVNTLSMPGSFAMTELGHGSNVQGVETIATYDEKTHEFVIKTPSDSAQKYWIGNAAKHGKWTVVFAQLHHKGKNLGVHVFVSDIRNADGTTAKDVRLADNGHKLGLWGIDNGRMWFDNKRVPREYLLNRIADMTESGEYKSDIADPVKRFAAMVAPLVIGRVSVAASAVHISKIALTIAIRYAHRRTQFSDKAGRAVPIIEYMTHQRRLYPYLAATLAYQTGINYLKSLVLKNDHSPDGVKAVHTVASGIKAMATWNRSAVLQQTREACGGQGFSTHNRIAQMKSDSDVDLTYEGDNTVLLQQVTAVFVQAVAKGAFQARTEPVTGSTDDVATGLAALHWRESHVVKRLQAALASTMKSTGMSSEDAWNAHVDLVVDAGKAHVESLVARKFAEFVDAPAAAPLREALTPVLLMFLHHVITQDLGYFVSHEGISPAMGRSYHEGISKYCTKMHPIALRLTDAFKIPPHCLVAPIAGDYIASNRYEISRNGPTKLIL